MVAAATAKKADHWFNMADRDGDGQITRDDLLNLAHGILNHFGHSAEDPKGRALVRAYEQAWVYMANAMDTDRNQAISKEEFRSYMDQHANRDNADEALRPITDAEFAAADVDDDGYLSREEYADLLRALNLSDSDSRMGASKVDTNRDGRISPEEYFRACRDFFAAGENLDKKTGQVFGRV